MALQRLLVFYPFLVVVLFVTIPLYTCSQQDPLFNNYKIEELGYDPQAYPSYIDMIEDGLFMGRNDVSSLKRFDEVGSTSTSVKTVSVDDFGAKGDGNDDTEAFEKAWKEACSCNSTVLVVPENNYLVKPIRFSGPCKSDLTVQIYGSIEASEDRSDYKEDGRHWLRFDSVQNLLIEGGGTIDGNGKIWWENSCKTNKSLPCKDAPTALTFYKCENLVVRNLKVQNALQIHVSLQSSVNVQVSNIMVTSPEHSPNTDGIHVTETQNIKITDSVIGTGDDCISIASGSQNVEMMNITCGPGHGISIGSLGKGNSKAYVSSVTVNGAKLLARQMVLGSKHGRCIYHLNMQGGSGTANNIEFQNIEMDNVTNPIIIDQYYCDRKKPCKEESSAVQVKNVVYNNIKGTSAFAVAIKFNCSKRYPCQGIWLQDIDLEREGPETAKAQCNNIDLVEVGNVSPSCRSI